MTERGEPAELSLAGSLYPFLTSYFHAGFGCLCFFLAGGFGGAGLVGFFGRGVSLRKLISNPFGFRSCLSALTEKTLQCPIEKPARRI
jgi:hypothetical protein